MDEFQDIESGGKLHKKGLNSLLDIVEEGKIDVVVYIDQDRLSRLDTISWEYLRTKETWEKIQIERNKRGNQYKVTSRKRNDLHLLRRTYFVCGECGEKISHAAHGTKESPRYYLKHGRKLRLADRSVCDVSINTVRVEGNIQAIKDIVTSKELAKQYVNLENEKEEITQLEQNIKNNEQILQKQTTKNEKLIDLYLDNHLTKEQLNKKQLKSRT